MVGVQSDVNFVDFVYVAIDEVSDALAVLVGTGDGQRPSRMKINLRVDNEKNYLGHGVGSTSL
jgi:hypothetical protein